MFCLFLLALNEFFLQTLSTRITVHSPSGSISGISLFNGTIMQFRNIPYAKPPLGKLRFQKPVPYGSWSEVRDGSKFGPSCMQDMSYSENLEMENRNISEDCLSLNVYVPCDLPSKTEFKRKRSVMIWIYGGSYIIGQGEIYDATALAVTGDVVVVTLNYRLGIFGFLSTGDDAARGNYGLWDQHLAIVWVKHNIEAFGGNPDSITLFGQSAGGFSVTYQSFATQNSGLFQRVIAQSGVSNSRLSYTTDELYFANRYGSDLHCQNSSKQISNEDLVSCLKGKSSYELLSSQYYFLLPEDRAQFLLNPAVVIDGEFVVDSPHNILREKSSESYKMFKSLDYITGNCNNEGSIIVPYLQRLDLDMYFNFTEGVPTRALCDRIDTGLLQDLYRNQKAPKIASDKICSNYKSNDPAEQGRLITNLYTDVFFIAPSVELLDAHSQYNHMKNTYQYVFFIPDVFHQGLVQTPPWFQGSSHGSEIPFLFGLQYHSSVFNHSNSFEYLQLSETMLKYWTNFAKTGNPNGNGLPYWPTYDQTHGRYIHLDIPITTRSHYNDGKVKFWNNDIPISMKLGSQWPVVVGK